MEEDVAAVWRGPMVGGWLAGQLLQWRCTGHFAQSAMAAVHLTLFAVPSPSCASSPQVMSALDTFMQKVQWSPLDVLVIDMPPGTGALLHLIRWFVTDW